jgi:hypothetical protein
MPLPAGRDAYYGRCRAYRAKRARERYQTDPRERAAQTERVRRNREKRKANSSTM